MLGDRWGVTDDEVAATYACDDHVQRPALRAWRGITVEAPPEATWRRVVQVRLAPYSYDWLDNLGRRSPRELRDLPDPAPGDAFTATAGRPLGRVVDVEPGRSVTGEILGAFLTYRVAPHVAGSRLVLKVVMETSRPVALGVCLGDLVMARMQLRTLRTLAEQDHRAGR